MNVHIFIVISYIETIYKKIININYESRNPKISDSQQQNELEDLITAEMVKKLQDLIQQKWLKMMLCFKYFKARRSK